MAKTPSYPKVQEDEVVYPFPFTDELEYVKFVTMGKVKGKLQPIRIYDPMTEQEALNKIPNKDGEFVFGPFSYREKATWEMVDEGFTEEQVAELKKDPLNAEYVINCLVPLCKESRQAA